MKYIVLLLIAFIFSTSISAQKFTGEIEYHVSFIAKNDAVNIDSIQAAFPGNKSIYLIKDGYYKTSYFKSDTLSYSYTYENITKRMYDQRPNVPYIKFRDSKKPNLEPHQSKIYKDSTSKILGKTCFLVVYNEGNSITKTYYTNKIKVDASAFENHEVGNWYNKLKEVNGCIGLKTVTEYDDYIMVYEAVNINKRKVERTEFALPPNTLLVAAYSSLDKNVELVETTQEQLDCYFNKVDSALLESPVSEPFTSVVSFVITKTGEVIHVNATEEDDYGFYKVAMDIVSSCGLKFVPGQINGSNVSSLTFFPVTFK